MSHGPDFILAGAQRAGSTALAEALGVHPGVHMTDPKEPSYFATMFGALDFCGPGDQWFASQNVADWDEYLALCASEAAVVGEASVMYLAIEGTAAAIKERLPDAKIVVVLRDPLARARSAHSYLRVQGRETEKVFSAALAKERERRAAGFGPMWWFAEASDYARGLAKYFDLFGRDRVLVTTNEELKAAPAAVLAEVTNFLGIAHSEAPVSYLASNSVNSGGVPRNELFTKILYPPDRVRAALRRLAPEKLRGVIRTARTNSTTAGDEADQPLADDVIERFRDMAIRAGDLLGRDMSEVWPSAKDANG